MSNVDADDDENYEVIDTQAVIKNGRNMANGRGAKAGISKISQAYEPSCYCCCYCQQRCKPCKSQHQHSESFQWNQQRRSCRCDSPTVVHDEAAISNYLCSRSPSPWLQHNQSSRQLTTTSSAHTTMPMLPFSAPVQPPLLQISLWQTKKRLSSGANDKSGVPAGDSKKASVKKLNAD